MQLSQGDFDIISADRRCFCRPSTSTCTFRPLGRRQHERLLSRMRLCRAVVGGMGAVDGGDGACVYVRTAAQSDGLNKIRSMRTISTPALKLSLFHPYSLKTTLGMVAVALGEEVTKQADAERIRT